MTMSAKRSEQTVIQLPGGKTFSVRPATPSDVPNVTKLIHNAFEIWKKQGLSLGPMRQTDAQTWDHLVGKGYVAENADGEIVGTFSLDDGLISRPQNAKLALVSGQKPPVLFSYFGKVKDLPPDRALVFMKAAVRSDVANSGLGAGLFELAETIGRENGYSGMILETVKEAAWLYEWYLRLGFEPIGSCRYPGSKLDTILMSKPFGKSR